MLFDVSDIEFPPIVFFSLTGRSYVYFNTIGVFFQLIGKPFSNHATIAWFFFISRKSRKNFRLPCLRDILKPPLCLSIFCKENKLRPLIFGNFFRNIQKIKNGLRPSFVQSFALYTFPPRGRLGSRRVDFSMAFKVVLVENKLRPSSVNYVDSFPPRGSLDGEKASNFCRRKFCKQNFMQARGSL